MKGICWLIGLLVLCGMSVEVHAGGPPPICMAVDKLVFEPNEDAPTRIQIWGTFALLNDTRNAYGEPVRRYLYYTATPGTEAESQKEWASLKKLVAEQHVVAYGMCGEPKVSGQLRKPAEKVESPTAFPLVKPGFANADQLCTSYPALHQLRKLAQHRPGKEITAAAPKADPPSK